MLSRLITLTSILMLLSPACGSDSGSDPDAASQADAPVADASPPDGTPADAAPVDALPPVGGHTRYVAYEVLMPVDNTTAEAYGLDIDGDPSSRPDNALGQVIATLASQGLDIQGGTDELVANGELLYLIDVEADSLVDEADALLKLFLGEDGDVPPNPADNFSGDETFNILEDSPTDSNIPGPITAGDLDLGPGTATIYMIGLLGVDPVPLPLIGARVVGEIDTYGILDGRIGGGILEADVDTILVPAIAEAMQNQVDAECFDAPPTCCPADSTGETYLALFDLDHDCEITSDELLDGGSLMGALLAPDVDLLDSNNGDIFDPRKDGIKDCLSVGIGFHATRAQFDLP